MKKNFFLALSLLVFCFISVHAVELPHGAYGVAANTSYSNPDTKVIDDNGSDNALGDAMSRSCTATSALIEKDGDKYYVTIRLLLQSSTNDANFYERIDYNTYSSVNYEIIAENAVADSIDYRFEMKNPFAPLKVSMYVVPMGRDVVWFVQLDESSITSNTGDFIVNIISSEVEKDIPQLDTDSDTTTPLEQNLSEEIISQNDNIEIEEPVVQTTEVILNNEATKEEILIEDLYEDLHENEINIEIYEDIEYEEYEEIEEIISEIKTTDETAKKTSSNKILISSVIFVTVCVALTLVVIKKRGK